MITTSQKLLLVCLTILAVGIVSFGIMQISYRIHQPFLGTNQLSKELTVDLGQIDLAELQSKLDAAQTKDTDGDGLTDFTERVIYQTSIYLADSDSDGYNDKEEIDAGSAPLNSQSTPLNIGQESLVTQTETKTEEPSEQLSAEEIKRALQLAGVDQAVLQQIDQQTLIDLYRQTVQQTGTDLLQLQQQQQQRQQPGDSPLIGQDLDIDEIREQSNQLAKQQLQEMDIKEIRQLLLVNGMDLETLNQIDDQTLRTLLAQILQNE